MGLFDSVSGFLGEIQNNFITLDCKIQERACDRYTGAKSICTKPSANTTVSTTPVQSTNHQDNIKTTLKEADDCAEELKPLLSNTAKDIEKEDKENYNHRLELIDTDAKSAFKAVYDKLICLIDNTSANILANVLASAIVAGEDPKNISLDNILAYCNNANIANDAAIKAMNDFATDKVKDIICNSEIKISSVNNLTKPFTMDFSQFVKSNDNIMPQVV